MEPTEIFFEDFSKAIKKTCARDTSANPEFWSAENPMWGHCAVVALIAQDLFGGALVRQSLEKVAGLEYLRFHYSNKLADGTNIDFTLEQFQGKLPANLPKEERTRERVLSYPNTQKRYKLLKDRFKANTLKV